MDDGKLVFYRPSAMVYRPLSPVLFPTFALKYHVPFRNKIRQYTSRAFRRTCGHISLFKGMWLEP